MELMSIKMETSMMVIGKMILSKAKENSGSTMGSFMKENLNRVINMEKAHIVGNQETLSLGSSNLTKGKALEYIHGQMEAFIRENGEVIG